MIESIIQEIIEGLTTADFTFYGSDMYEANAKADKLKSPFGLLVHPLKGRDIILPFGNQKTSWPLAIMFSIQSKLAQTMPQRNANVQMMLAAKKEFVVRLYNHAAVEKIESCEHEEFINEFSRNMDGIMLFVTPVLYPSENLCYPAT